MTTAVGLGVQISAGQHPVRGGPPATLAQRRGFHTYRAAPIETVVVGDEVRASDLETRAGGSCPVTAVHRDLGTGFAELLVREADGDLALTRATTHHEIWDSAAQDWAHAIQLGVGDALPLANGRTITVVALITYAGQRLMYDPSVQRVHTYYVMAGEQSVLVHNAGGGCPTGVPGVAGEGGGEYLSRVGRIADQFGATSRQVKDAIHALKRNLPRGGPVRNPDVEVHPTTGEVYPKLPGGGRGDSIGDIYDHLPPGG